MAAACTGGDGGDPPVPDFELDVEPELRVLHGGTAELRVRVVRSGASDEPVTLRLAGTEDITSSVIVVPPDASAGTMTIEVGFGSAQGAIDVTVNGTSGEVRRAAPVRLLVYGPPGTIDHSFLSSGIDFTPQALEIGPDDRISLAGVRNGDAAVRRLTVRGAADTFGDNGTLQLPIGSGFDIAADVAAQTDGKLVFVGGTVSADGRDTFVARATNDGAPDPTFGSGGKVVVDLGGFDAGHAVAVLPDGKILVAAIEANELVMLRLDAEGRLDATYGDGGQIRHFGMAAVSALRPQPTGRVLLVGARRENEDRAALVVVRLLATGGLDPEFSDDGVVSATPSTAGAGFITSGELDVALDGTIVVCGMANSGGGFVVRISGRGVLDAAFGVDGIATLPSLGNVVAVRAASNGTIYLAGAIGPFSGGYLARLQASGDALDPSYGAAGLVEFAAGGFSTRAAFSADGRVVVTGESLNKASIVRLWL